MKKFALLLILLFLTSPASAAWDTIAGEGIDLTTSGTTLTILAETATSSNLGVASFSSTEFVVGSGVVSIAVGAIDPCEMATADFGDIDITNCVMDIQPNVIGGAELDEDLAFSPAGTWNFSAGTIIIPTGTTLPSSECDEVGEAGALLMKTDATSGQQIYGCEGTGGWVLQGDGGTGGGGTGATTDFGGNTGPTSTTDNFTIGTTLDTIGGKLTVDGDVDQIQTIIQGHSTQTNNLFVLEQSDGTDVFTVTNLGVVTSAGTIIAPSFEALASATPTTSFVDSDTTDEDDSTQIVTNCTDTGSGTEDCDMTFSQQIAGAMTAFLTADADGNINFGRNLTTPSGTVAVLSDITGGSGDVTGVGDCASGACGDGTSDGGTYIRLYDGDSNYAELGTVNLSGDVSLDLPNQSGTLAVLGDITGGTITYLKQWNANQGYPCTASNFATLDTRNYRPVLDFDGATNESICFDGIMPDDYSGSGVTVSLYTASSGTTGDMDWGVAFEDTSAQDTDSFGFAATNFTTGTSVNGTSGIQTEVTIAFTDGADMDSASAGDPFVIRINRDAASDTSTDDNQLLRVGIYQ